MTEHESGGRRQGDPEERPEMHPERCIDHAGICADLASAEAREAENSRAWARLEASFAGLELRVRGLELRIAAWAGAAALLGAIIPRIIDSLTPAAHAVVALVGR